MNKNKKTVLYYEHMALLAKMAPFGGFEMPIQYEGILKEHHNTRENVSVFDTCHMGEFRISGETAQSDLEKIVTCRISDMEKGQCRYGFICNENGGIIDDMIVYKIHDSKFFMVVNSATKDKDYEWIKSHISQQTNFTDVTDITAKIDIQGPKSPKLIKKLLLGENGPLEELKYYRFMYDYFESTKVLISRTGYTGEIGFEIYAPSDIAVKLWRRIIELGAKPAGLGARDTLRLEMGYPLYGNELNENIIPTQTGYKKAIDFTKNFIGKEKIEASQANLVLCGIKFDTRQASHPNNKVYSYYDDSEIGYITSGAFSPSLKQAIALAYIDKKAVLDRIEVLVDTGRKKLLGKIVNLPFYKGTATQNIKNFL